MRSKSNINSFAGLIIATLFTLLLFSGCTDNNDYPDTPDDPLAARRDSISRILISDINADSIKANTEWLESFGTRFALASNRKKVAESIRDRFKRVGLSDARIDSFQVTINYQGIDNLIWQYNVIAHLHGNQYPQKLSVTGAHYDDYINVGDPYTNAPGADDNASGVAITIEIARVMVKNNYIPYGSINFVAFAAEEFGLLGSKEYNTDANEHGDEVVLMLNNDMVSYETNTKVPLWQMTIAYYSNSFNFFQEVYSYFGRYTTVVPFVNNNINMKSDSYSFALNNIRAVYFSEKQLNPYYHTVNDKSVYCNFIYSREVAKITCATLVYNN